MEGGVRRACVDPVFDFQPVGQNRGQILRDEPVVSADEPGWRINGQNFFVTRVGVADRVLGGVAQTLL